MVHKIVDLRTGSEGSDVQPNFQSKSVQSVNRAEASPLQDTDPTERGVPSAEALEGPALSTEVVNTEHTLQSPSEESVDQPQIAEQSTSVPLDEAGVTSTTPTSDPSTMDAADFVQTVLGAYTDPKADIAQIEEQLAA